MQRAAPTPVASTPTPTPAPAVEERALRFELLALAGVSTLLSARADLALGLTFALEHRWLRIQLTPVFFLGQSISSSAGLASYRAYGGQLAVFGSYRALNWLALQAGVGVQIAALTVNAPQAELARPQVGVAISPAVMARVPLLLGAWRLGLEGGLGFGARAERFVIENAGEVFRVPVVGGFVGAFVGRTIP